MKTKIKKLAILTSGGDSSGMNNAIRAVIKKAIVHKIKPFLIFGGYKGLYEGKIVNASEFNSDDYISKGGSFIQSTRFPEFKKLQVREVAKQRLEKEGMDALVVIGGDGSWKGANLLCDLGLKIVCLPATIDNDIASTDFTIGYDTALNSIVENVERIKDTATSHNRAIIVEVMGRYCDDLALFSSLATGANLVVTNERNKTPKQIGELVKSQYNKEKSGIIIIVAEHIYKDLKEVAQVIESTSGITTRSVVLGHTQRGGNPTAFERILASRMGIKAVEMLVNDYFNVAIVIKNNEIKAIPIKEALAFPIVSQKNLIDTINEINQI